MEIILVRHGRPDEENERAPHDPPLSEAGRMQAEAVARLLRQEAVTHVIASPMLRAQQTAAPLSELSGRPVETIDGWAEADRDRGPYRSIETIRAAGDDVWQRFLEDPIRFMGADPDRFRNAVLSAFHAAVDSREPGSRVVVFTHGMPINIVIAHLLALRDHAPFAIQYGSVTRIRRAKSGRAAMLSVNETAHQRMHAERYA